MIVMKFGGTSVESAAAIERVASIVKARKDRHPIVVVSAMGKTTNQLIEKAKAISASPSRRELDMLLTCGEREAMSLLSMACAEEGLEAISFTGSQSGITVRALSEIQSPDYPADVVLAQQPPAKASAGDVALLVNRAERGVAYVMPDFIGVNGERAAESLRQRGFRASVVSSAPYPGVGAGIVLRQSPQAGFQIKPDEPISLEVSK